MNDKNTIKESDSVIANNLENESKWDAEDFIEEVDDDDLIDEDSETDSYFDDDELFLAGDDKVVHEDDVMALFKQTDRAVMVQVLNFRTPNGDVRKPIFMKNDPPILEVTSSQGDKVELILTKELSQHLAKQLEDVRRAYFGIAPKNKTTLTQESIKDKINDFVTWMKAHKIKTIVGVLAVVMIISGLFFI
jgi:hypothetical protein